jgi:hypothetical protein
MSNISPLEINFEPTIKQDEIFQLFDDDITTEILYGGSAGSAKSYGLCALIILKCLQHDGIRVGLARNELTNLKKTTIISFFEVAANWGLIPDEHFTYNSTAGIIKFYNGSEVILLDLSFKPSDPKYTRLGGHLLTFGCVDEIGEVDEQGFQIFKTRLGRWKNEDYQIKPIVISTCNPSKNWIYREYYKPSIDGTIKPYQAFIQALPTDNPYIPQSYLDNLKKLPYAERERLLLGNWDYDDDPNSLLSYEEILNVWVNIPRQTESASNRFISADIAFTSDKLVIMVWDKYTVIDIIVGPEGNIEDVINELAKKYNVPQYNICYDSDGVGKFLTTRLRNAKPIVNNSRAFKDENYKNLKTQLYFKLAELISNNSVKILTDKYKNEIIEELQLIKHKPSDVVGKIEMVDKGEVKRTLGRSPDFSDAMAYRMYFEFKTVGVKSFRIG